MSKPVTGSERGWGAAVLRVLCWGAGALGLVLAVFGVVAVMGRVESAREAGRGVPSVEESVGVKEAIAPVAQTRPVEQTVPATQAGVTVKEPVREARELSRQKAREAVREAREQYLRLAARDTAWTAEQARTVAGLFREALLDPADWAGDWAEYATAQRWAGEAWMQMPEGISLEERGVKTLAVRQARSAFIAAREAERAAGLDSGAALSELIGDLWVMELVRLGGVNGEEGRYRGLERMRAGVMAYNDALRTFKPENRQADWLRVRLKTARLFARELSAAEEPERLTQAVAAYRLTLQGLDRMKDKQMWLQVNEELAQKVAEAFSGEKAGPDQSSLGGLVRRQNLARLECLKIACQSAENALSELSLAQAREGLEKQLERLETLVGAYEEMLAFGASPAVKGVDGKAEWKAGQEGSGPAPTRRMMLKKRSGSRGK